MADIACLSKYHFTKVFQNNLCETPHQFLLRTRLEYAARSFTYQPDQSITQVAINCGFTDGAAFSNAFRKQFELSPRSFRNDKNLEARDTPKQEIEFSTLIRNRVKIVEKPRMRLAYVRNFGPYLITNSSIFKATDLIVHWAKTRGLWSSNTAYVGLCPSNPSLTPPGFCIYDACIQVPEEIEEDEIISIQTIPVGKYAVVRVPYAPIQKQAWNWLASEWLPFSREAYAFEYSYELRRGNIIPNEGVDLCMRLVSHQHISK